MQGEKDGGRDLLPRWLRKGRFESMLAKGGRSGGVDCYMSGVADYRRVSTGVLWVIQRDIPGQLSIKGESIRRAVLWESEEAKEGESFTQLERTEQALRLRGDGGERDVMLLFDVFSGMMKEEVSEVRALECGTHERD